VTDKTAPFNRNTVPEIKIGKACNEVHSHFQWYLHAEEKHHKMMVLCLWSGIRPLDKREFINNALDLHYTKSGFPE
jgi:hypothetical protein